METGMRVVLHRQVSAGSLKHSGELRRQSSLESPRTGRATSRFLFGRQSSMDPNRRRGRSQSPVGLAEELTVPDNLDATMQLLFMACHGDATGVEVLLRGGVDVNSINLDGRTALHIATCEGHPDVVRVLLNWKANIDARDRWGSTAAADAKCYGHTEIYNLLKSRGAKIPISFYKNCPFHLRNRRTPMTVSNPGEIPKYELNPGELQFQKGDEVLKGTYQVAKWNGTKVSVKILDRESYSDQESMLGTLLLLLFRCISSVVNSQPLASSQDKTLSRASRSSRLASGARSRAPNSASSRHSTSAPTNSTAPSTSRKRDERDV